MKSTFLAEAFPVYPQRIEKEGLELKLRNWLKRHVITLLPKKRIYVKSVYIFFHILIYILSYIFYDLVLPGIHIIHLLEFMIACLNNVFWEGLIVSFDTGWQKRGSGRSGKVFILSQKLGISALCF